jgi:hypothetical protein
VTAGPFQSEHDARSAAHSLIPPSEGMTILTSAQNRQLIGRACETAGVGTSRYEDGVIEWLSGWEDSVCAVIAGWVTRAHASGIAGRVKDGSDEGSGENG